MDAEEESCCQISKKAYTILETMMTETNLGLEDLIKALFSLYRTYSIIAPDEPESNSASDDQCQTEKTFEIKTPVQTFPSSTLRRSQRSTRLGTRTENTGLENSNSLSQEQDNSADTTKVPICKLESQSFGSISTSPISAEDSQDDSVIHLSEEAKDILPKSEVESDGKTKKRRKPKRKNMSNGKNTSKKMRKKKLCKQEIEKETEQAVESIGNPKADIFNQKEPLHIKNRPFCCSICAANFKLKHHLEAHMNVHKSGTIHICEECKKQFKSADNLKRHAKTHQAIRAPKKYKCDVCKYQSDYPSDINKHKVRHTEEKCFKCDVCNFETNWKKNLKDHMTTHSVEKKFNCEQCDYVTHSMINLGSHVKRCHGPKWVCEVCGEEYCSLEYLAEHLNKHGNVLPHVCPHCSYRTSYRANFQKHCLIHTQVKRHKCDTCNKRFTQKSHLDAHIKAIHSNPNKEYRCHICEYVTMRSQSLNSHMKKHHKSKDKDNMQNNLSASSASVNVNNDQPVGIPTKSDVSVNLDNLVAAAEILAECSSPEKDMSAEHNYAVSNIIMSSAPEIAFQNQAQVLMPDVHILGPSAPNLPTPVPISQQQQQILLSQEFHNLNNLPPRYQDSLTLPVLNVHDFHQQQTAGEGYSTYTIHHVMTPLQGCHPAGI
ncbi:zinc finger protein 112-like [Lineus longissimus]|uniref:zinc finger protein 112-like n=1 Tax=Lineus longissimus TaxID=88925 RepID=UPI00315D6F1B